MTKQIDELMALADEYAKAWHASQTSRLIAAYDDGDHRKALRTALEAALKPGEVVAMRGDFDGYGYQYIDSGSGSNWRTRHTDWEPVYDGPPAQTPPPRLTDAELLAINETVKPLHVGNYARAIETEVRRQFLGDRNE